jgi:hypothetical protein
VEKSRFWFLAWKKAVAGDIKEVSKKVWQFRIKWAIYQSEEICEKMHETE